MNRPRRGKRLDDAFLERVAEVYRDAIARAVPPTEEVARVMHAARSTAGRYVVEARRRGILGATTQGQAGEKTPRTNKGGTSHGKR